MAESCPSVVEPPTYAIRVVRGCGLELSLVYATDEDGDDPIDLTGCEAALTAFDADGDTVWSALSTGSDPGITITAVTGAVDVDAEVDIATGKYRYDLKLTPASGPTVCILRGPFTVLEGSA